MSALFESKPHELWRFVEKPMRRETTMNPGPARFAVNPIPPAATRISKAPKLERRQ
jgi:hypothetical protein